MKGHGIIRVIMIFTLMGMMATGGCKNSGKSSQTPTAANSGSPAALPRELELPRVPASMTDPAERAAYATGHFWDALDPADHTLSLDSAFMEQSFANFIGLLPYANEEAREKAIGNFTDKCAEDAAVYDLAVYIAQHYLDDPNSPMRNEELYIPFLRRFASDSMLGEAMQERAKFRLEQARKNRPGMKAANFRLEMRDGRTSTLLREVNDTTLVLFYDYDCDHCKETVARLQNPDVGLPYSIMAIEVTEQREGWDATKGDMPET